MWQWLGLVLLRGCCKRLCGGDGRGRRRGKGRVVVVVLMSVVVEVVMGIVDVWW